MTSLFLAAIIVLTLAACGESESNQTGSNTSQAEATTAEPTSTEPPANAETGQSNDGSESTDPIGTVANTLAEDEDTLIATYADKFEQKSYSDSESGLSITYNLYLPEGYDASGSYPMVVFIGDSSCAGNDATVSLTQGRGGLVWTTEEWQAVYPTIVAVPAYPETISMTTAATLRQNMWSSPSVISIT